MSNRTKETMMNYTYMLLVFLIAWLLASCATLPKGMPIISQASLSEQEFNIVLQAVIELNAKAGQVLVAVTGEGYHVDFEKQEFEGYTAATATMEQDRCVIRLKPELFTSLKRIIGTVVWHELGHCKGLGHVQKDGEIMSPQVSALKSYPDAAINRFIERMRQ